MLSRELRREKPSESWTTRLFRLSLLLFKRKPKFAALKDDGPDSALETEIRRGFGFAFESYGAQIVSSRYFSRAFGNGIVELECGNLRILIERDRGTLFFDVAPKWQPEDRVALLVVLESISSTDDPSHPSCFTYGPDDPIGDVNQVLKPRMNRLQEAFSPENYEETRAQIERTRSVKSGIPSC